MKFDCSIAVVGSVNISSGLLKVDGLDIVSGLATKATITNLALKADASNVFTKAESNGFYQPKIDTLDITN